MEEEQEQALGAAPDGDTAPNDSSPEPNDMPTQEIPAAPEPSSTQMEAEMAIDGNVTPAPADGAWRETSERVRMSAPGFPQWVVTADRTYYPVTLVEDPKAPNGICGEILVHPGHVAELRATTDHRVLA